MSTRPASGLGVRAALAVTATAIEKLVSLGIALYLPRHLELADYGRYAFVMACANFFQVLPDTALEAVLVARIAGTDREPGRLAGQGATVRLVVALVGAALTMAFLLATARGRGMLPPAAIYALGLVLYASNPYKVLLRGRLRMRRYLVLLTGQGVVAITLVALAILAGGGLVGVVGGLATAALWGVVLGRLLAGRGARLGMDRPMARALFAGAWPLAGGSLVLAAAQQVLLVVLLRAHGEEAMAFFGGATKIVEAVGLLPTAVMVTVLPALSRAERATDGLATARAADAAKLLVVLLMPVCLLLVWWPAEVLRLGMGERLVPASGVLQVGAAFVLLGATGLVITNLLIAAGLQRPLFLTTALGAVTMVVLGAVLVPAGGSVGAAAAVAVAMFVGQAALLLVPATRARVAAVLRAVVAPLAAGAVAVAAAATVPVPPLAGVALLAGVYLAGLLVTGTLGRAQLARWLH